MTGYPPQPREGLASWVGVLPRTTWLLLQPPLRAQGYLTESTTLQFSHFQIYLLPLQVLTMCFRQDEQTCQTKDLWQRAEESWTQINLGLACQLRMQRRKELFPFIFFRRLIRSRGYLGDTHTSTVWQHRWWKGWEASEKLLKTSALPSFLPSSKCSPRNCSGVRPIRVQVHLPPGPVHHVALDTFYPTHVSLSFSLVKWGLSYIAVRIKWKDDTLNHYSNDLLTVYVPDTGPRTWNAGSRLVECCPVQCLGHSGTQQTCSPFLC